MICHIESSEKFFVHPIQELTMKYEEVQYSLKQMEDSLQRIEIENIKEGTKCVLRQGSELNRVVVTSAGSDMSTISLELMDFGTPVTNPINTDLFVLPWGWLYDLPALAVPCKLAYVPPLNVNNLAFSKQILVEKLNYNVIHTAVLLREGDLNEIVIFGMETTLNEEIVDAFNSQKSRETEPQGVEEAEIREEWNPMNDDYQDLSNNYNTNDNDLQVVTDGYRSKSNICPFFTNSGRCYKGQLCEDIHDLPRTGAVTTDVEEIIINTLEQQSWPRTGDTVLVKVVWIQSPGFFYVTFPYGSRSVSEITEEARKNTPTETPWTRMEAEMKDLYRDARKYFLNSLPSPGQLVAVKSGGGCQRAMVTMDLEDDDSVEVFFVDKGVRKVELLKNLRILDSRFTSLPYLVYEAELYGLVPVGSTWKPRSGHLLESFLTYGEYTMAKIRGYSGDKLQVELTSVEEHGTADISSLLCEANQAYKVQAQATSAYSAYAPG